MTMNLLQRNAPPSAMQGARHKKVCLLLEGRVLTLMYSAEFPHGWIR